MVFYGTNKYYKRMLMLGIPLTLIILVFAFFTQGNDFAFLNVLLFAACDGAIGGLIVLPLVYMLGREKRVVLDEEELRLEESKHPRVAKYSDIKDVSFEGRQIQILLSTDKIIINNVHGYPMDKIYRHLEENRLKVN